MVEMQKPLLKQFFILLMACQGVFALEAPYLISATALSDSSVQLTWRNNDVATVGFIVQRADSGGSVFLNIDSVKSATLTSYIDTKRVQPQVTYTYRMMAYNADSVSLPSNTQQATTLARNEVFKKPAIKVYWNFDTSKSVRVTIYDSSNCETGFRIYRDIGFSGTFSRIAEIASVNPGKMDPIVWCDTMISINTWCNYRIAAFKNNDSIYSESCSTYTFHGIEPQKIVKFEKLGEVSVNPTIWSAQSGDSIICKENPSPAGKYSVINIKDPQHPKFDGYADSLNLLTYPLKTLIPLFVNFNVSNSYLTKMAFNYKDRILIFKEGVLKMYRIENDMLNFIDSLKININPDMRCLLLNDTLWAMQFYASNGFGDDYHLYPVYLSASGFSPLSEYILGSDFPGYQHQDCIPYVRGIYDNKIFISVDVSGGGQGSYWSWHDETVDDLSAYRRIFLRAREYRQTIRWSYSNAFNTGLYISSDKNICTNGFSFGQSGPSEVPTELFAADIRYQWSHWFDSLNNAIYRDTVHKQNTIQNILLDTLNKRIFLIFQNNLTILGYNYASADIANRPNKFHFSVNRLTIFTSPFAHSATIILPSTSRPSDLYFYDLFGRLIDQITGITSNAVLWRPKVRSSGCYFVVVKSGAERFVEKFILR